MANIINQNGQVKVGFRSNQPTPSISTVWNNIYSVYNADSVGSSSLKTSLYAAYNGESNANDSYGTNNGTAVGGLTYTTGKIGNAFNLNGTNSYVTLPNSANQFNFTGDFSVSCWFKTNTVSGNQMIFSNLMYNGGNRKGYYIGLYGDAVEVWLVNQPTFNLEQYILTSSLISINTWYNIVVTRESGVVKIYVNNSLIITNNNAITMGYISTSPSIGAYTNGLPISRYFNGQIDALNIWQKSLTQSEITELYNSGNGAQYITNDFYKPTTNDALNLRNGTPQGGLTYGVGKIGTAFQFNGTNSLISLPSNSIAFSNTFSVSFWVSVGSNGTTQTILSTYTNISGAERGLLIRLASSGVMSALGFNSSGSLAFNSNVSGGAIPTNTWRHFTITVSTTQVKWYVNSVLDGTFTISSNISHRANTEPGIGAYYKYDGTNNLAFMSNGSKIDAFNVWNKVLTQSEITELYNSGNGKQYPN